MDKQLEGTDCTGLRHVRTATEVEELALAIKRNCLVVAEPFFDVFDFVGLIEVATDFAVLCREVLPAARTARWP